MQTLPIWQTVRIVGFDYTIEYDDLLAEKGLLAEIQLLHQRILVRPGMSDDSEKVAILHEIGHGVLYHCGIKQHDEPHLDVLSSGYFQVQRDNPHIRI